MRRERDLGIGWGRLVCVGVLAASATAALPALASASDLSVTGTTIDYDADPGETNALVVTTQVGEIYVFTDAAGVTITPSGAECSGGGGPGVPASCTLAGATAVDVGLGDMDDTVDTTALPSTVGAILRGEAGGDTLESGLGFDDLDGGAGDDDLDGGGGDSDLARFDSDGLDLDMIVDLDAGTASGEGTDTLAGIENVFTSTGDDVLTGDANANGLESASGEDQLFGGEGGDFLQGGDGNDEIYGGTDDDILRGGDDDDTLEGGDAVGTAEPGSDLADYSSSGVGVTVNLSLTTPQATGEGTDTLSRVDNLVGTGNDDSLTGDDNVNFLNGLQGADSISGLGGADDLIGGGDAGDIAKYLAETGPITANLTAGTATTPAGTDTLTGFTDIWGTGAADTLIGDGGNNVLEGLGGNDTLEGRAGDDFFAGGASVVPFAGGIDTASFANSAGGVTVNLATAGAQATGEGSDTFTDIENLTGSPQDDTLTGDVNANRLEGAGGDDGLNGGDEDDNLLGGAGDDELDGGVGGDRASFTGATNAVQIDLEQGFATGEATIDDDLTSIENATGSPQGDTIIPSDAVNSIDGAGGDDLIYGVTSTGDGVGSDTFIGGAGTSDRLTYDPSSVGYDFSVPDSNVTGDGTTDTFATFELFMGSQSGDSFTGGGGVDNFDGLAGTDIAEGGGGADSLNGNAGNDILSGNGGVDLLTGGLNTDTADYSTAAGSVTATLTAAQAASNDGDGANDNLSGIEDLTGSANADDLTGGTGPNLIASLAGADTVRVRDGGPDIVDCGSEIDLAIVDAAETSITACETADDPSVIATPSITGSTPASGADENLPEISGTAPAGSTVSLFTTADCSGAAAATGSAATFASAGLAVAVPDNSTTTLYASATSALDSDGASGCSPGFTYVEATPPPAGPGDAAPETAITKLLKKTTDRTPTYRFTSSEQGSFQCKVDKGAFAACSSPFTLKKLKPGKHTFSVRAIDGAGNVDQSPASDGFKVKKKPKK